MSEYIMLVKRWSEPDKTIKLKFHAESKLRAELIAQKYAKHNNLTLLQVIEIEQRRD